MSVETTLKKKKREPTFQSNLSPKYDKSTFALTMYTDGYKKTDDLNPVEVIKKVRVAADLVSDSMNLCDL